MATLSRAHPTPSTDLTNSIAPVKLLRLEITNYRSIRSSTLTFGGLDCLVGPNNVGKSNTLRAISYLVEGESASDAIHYGKDPSNEIAVRGYFEIHEEDWERLKVAGKREPFENCVLADGTLGVCRRSGQKDLEVLRPYPKLKRLKPQAFADFHSGAWDPADKEGFRSRMEIQYPELVPYLGAGKETNKGEWTKAYDAFVKAAPADLEFELDPGPPPSGIAADLRNVLPRTIYVPAVKDAAESTKTSTRAELGALLDQLSVEVQEELDEAIHDALREVYARLNVVEDPVTHERSDGRHRGVRALEERISGYVGETFGDIGIALEFPNPGSRSIFQGAKVWVEEADFDRFSVSHVGEGVQRVLIFSLLRAYADLKRGRLHVREQPGNGSSSVQPALILYEEAELFLYPGLQIVLLRALQTLAEAGDQVVYTTHSPFMVQGEILGSINLLSKAPGEGTTSIEFHNRLDEHDARTQGRLLQIQHVSRYVFADRVVLVEGESDRIVLTKLARRLNPGEWDFGKAGIPILPVGGKGDLALFMAFMRSLRIKPFVVTDIDAIEDEIPRLSSDDTVLELRRESLELLSALCAGPGPVNKSFVRKLAGKRDWEDSFEALEVLLDRLKARDDPHEEGLAAVARFVAARTESAKRAVLMNPPAELRAKLEPLSARLLEEGVLLLGGYIENYYPSTAANKLEAALQFDESATDAEGLRGMFRSLPNGGTDIEVFLGKVFECGIEDAAPPERASELDLVRGAARGEPLSQDAAERSEVEAPFGTEPSTSGMQGELEF